MFVPYLLVAAVAGAIAQPPGSPHASLTPMLMQLSKEAITECRTGSGVEDSDIEAAKPGSGQKPNEKVLCFAKCLAEKAEFLKEDGTINIEKLKDMPKPPHMTEEMSAETAECLKKVGKIQTCADMEKTEECIKHNM